MSKISVVFAILVVLTLGIGIDFFHNQGHFLPAKRGAFLWRGHDTDESYYVAAVPMNVRLWKRTTGGLRAVAFSPDGSLLASGDSNGQVCVWRYPAKTLCWTFQAPDMINDLAFSPDGATLAVAGRNATTLWQTKTWKSLGLSLPAAFTHIAFAPDSKSIAISGEGHSLSESAAQAGVYAVKTGRLRYTLRGHTGSVPGIAFSPDGLLVATTSYDHTVKIWRADTGKLVRDIKGANGFGLGLAFSPNSHLLAAATAPDGIVLWDVQTGAIVSTTEAYGQCWTLAFSSDGRRLAAAGSVGVQIFDTDTWKRLYVVNERVGWPDQSLSGASTSAAFSPDGQVLAFGNTSLIVGLLPPQ